MKGKGKGKSKLKDRGRGKRKKVGNIKGSTPRILMKG
jgi:hypothetical protein